MIGETYQLQRLAYYFYEISTKLENFEGRIMSTTLVHLSYNNYFKMSNRPKPDDNLSGYITLDADNVIWHNEDLVFLQINLNDVVVIGEYTNSNGPWFDDWFITFITKDSKWHSIPWYAQNVEELTQVLSAKFSQQLKESLLTDSTTWKSIVRFPETIAGEVLFKRIPSKNYKAPKNIFQKLLYSLGLCGFDLTQDIELTDIVKSEINSSNH